MSQLQFVWDPRQEAGQAVEGVGHALHVLGPRAGLVAGLGADHVQQEGAARAHRGGHRDQQEGAGAGLNKRHTAYISRSIEFVAKEDAHKQDLPRKSFPEIQRQRWWTAPRT